MYVDIIYNEFSSMDCFLFANLNIACLFFVGKSSARQNMSQPETKLYKWDTLSFMLFY